MSAIEVHVHSGQRLQTRNGIAQFSEALVSTLQIFRLSGESAASLFRASITSGEEVFRRIQTGAVSDKQVSAIKEVEKGIDHQVKWQKVTAEAIIAGFEKTDLNKTVVGK